jgi:iron(III) transport system ATP-binding protein
MYLILDRLTKTFSTRDRADVVTAVDGISFGIEKGELVTLLGPSGCGKTTTLRLIAGFEVPTAGHLILDGQRLDDVPPNRRDMAMVFQSYAIFPHLNVSENVAYGLKIKKLSAREIRRRVAEVLSLTGLTGLEQRAPHRLSGGQQQRVALARALVMEPKVLLFDEPLSNLDAKLREQMRAEIRRIQQTLAITSVYVTHDQAEAMTLSDRIVVMNQGRVAQIGTAQQIYRRPANAFVADFIGTANFLPAQVVAVSAERLDLEVFGSQLSIDPPDVALCLGESVMLLARPEALRINTSQEGYPARVSHAVYLGPIVEYEVEVAGQTLALTQYDPHEVYPPGTGVYVQLVKGALYLLPKA